MGKKSSFWNEYKEAILIMLAFLLILSFIIFYKRYFPNFIEAGTEESFGQFGDFMGGTLNPFFAFLSFCLLLITIKIQSNELELSRNELAKSSEALTEQSKSLKIQNFETTFFNMIGLHNKIVDNFNFKKCEYSYYNKTLIFKQLEVSITHKEEAFKVICEQIDEISKNEDLFFTKFNEVYSLYYKEKQNILNKYFDNINQIFKFIDDSKFNKSEKKKYSDIFRVQFSQDELKLLFYHCVGYKGSITLKPYIEKFNFFEFLILEEKNKNFLFILNKSIYNIKAFGNNSLEIDNIIKSANEYLEKTDLDFTWKYFENYKNYCSYLFALEKYDLTLERLEELKTKLNQIVKDYYETNSISHETRSNSEKDLNILISYIYQIKNYINTSSQEQQ